MTQRATAPPDYTGVADIRRNIAPGVLFCNYTSKGTKCVALPPLICMPDVRDSAPPLHWDGGHSSQCRSGCFVLYIYYAREPMCNVTPTDLYARCSASPPGPPPVLAYKSAGVTLHSGSPAHISVQKHNRIVTQRVTQRLEKLNEVAAAAAVFVCRPPLS